MVTFKKVRKATVSYGRGSDNTRTPAHYGVFENGEQIGVIHARAVRFMEMPDWQICTTDYLPITQAGALSDAKEWSKTHAERFLAKAAEYAARNAS